MIDRSIVEQYLRVNGISPTAPDEVIKEVLFSAKWHETDIDTALMVLRENQGTHDTRIDSLRKVLHSDERLQPETISALLGINVDIKKPEQRQRESRLPVSSIMLLFGVAGALSCTFLLSAMWYFKIGIL